MEQFIYLKKNKLPLFVSTLLLLLNVHSLYANTSESSNYILKNCVISTAGNKSSTTNNQLTFTIGQPSRTGQSESQKNMLTLGFWQERFPKPVLDQIPDQEICADSPPIFLEELNPGVLEGLSGGKYIWYRDDNGKPDFKYGEIKTTDSSGKYWVKYFAPYQSGSDQSYFTLIKNALPVVNFTFKNVCDQQKMSFLNTSTSTSGKISRCVWSFGDGSQIEGCDNISHIFPEAGSYLVNLNLTTENGCMADTKKLVVVHEIPNEQISYNDPTSFCQGNHAVLHAPLSDNYSYQWQKNGINIVNEISPKLVVTESGKYSVLLTNEKNCSYSTDPVEITVYPLPTAIIISNSSTICFPEKATITIGLTGASPWNLTLTNGSSFIHKSNITKPILDINVSEAGTYYISDISDAHCSGSSKGSVNVVVNHKPQPGEIPVFGPPIACAGNIDYMYVYTYSANFLNDVNQYEWSVSSSDAEIISSPFEKEIKVRFTVDQPESLTVFIQLTATNDCGSTSVNFPVQLSTECVWPGDVNYDGTINDELDENFKLVDPVELTDFNILSSFTTLCISESYRKGTKRSVSCNPLTGECYLSDAFSYLWAPQPSVDWINWVDMSFEGTFDKDTCVEIYQNLLPANLKHFDTDGNGEIDTQYPFNNLPSYDPLIQAPRNDPEVIAYILATHPLTPPMHNVGQMNNNRRNRSHVITSPDVNIFLISESQTLSETTKVFEVTMGSESNPITDVSGVNFEIRLEKGTWENAKFYYSYFSYEKMTFVQSHLGRLAYNMSSMSLIHTVQKNVALIAMQRTDGESVTFSGEMLLRIECTFPIVSQTAKRSRKNIQRIPVEVAVASSNQISAKCEVKALTSSSAIIYIDDVYPPNSPSELSARTILPGQIILEWNDNSTTEDAFIVERSEGSRDAFVELATLSIDSTAYTDTSIQANSVYYYRIKAINEFGSSYSNEVNETTNISPTISSIEDQLVDKNTSLVIPFTINDHETLPSDLMVNVQVSNDTIIESLTVDGESKERTLNIMTSDSSNGQSRVTISVDDGSKTTQLTFLLTVTGTRLKFDSDHYIGNPENVLQFPIRLDKSDLVQIEGINVSLSFDSTVVSPISCILSDMLGSNYHLDMNTVAGTVRIGIMANSNLISFDGIIATLNMKIIGSPGATTHLEFTQAELNETIVHKNDALITVNDQPKAMDLTLTGNEDIEISETLSVIDEIGESLTYTIVENPIMGNLTLNVKTGDFIYQPFLNQNGTDTFTFKATDNYIDSNTATITLTITPEPDAPTISYIDSQFSWMDSQAKAIEFSIGDIDNSHEQLYVSGVSSNTDLVKSENIILECSENICSAQINTNEGKHGSTQITLSVKDNDALISSCTFDLIVGGLKLEMPLKTVVFPEEIFSIPLKLSNASNDLIQSIHLYFQFEPDFLKSSEQYILSTLLENHDYTQDVEVNNDEGYVSFNIMASSTPVPLSGIITNLMFNASAQSPANQCISIKPDSTLVNLQSLNAQTSSVCFTETIISGSVHYFTKTLSGDEKPVPNVILSLTGDVYYTTTTNESGDYTFDGLPPGNYEVTPQKRDTSTDALNSSDASIIAQSSVGIRELNCYELIAADVTLNGGVSAMDASNVARFKIGLTNCLNDDCMHWAFVSNPIQTCNKWDKSSILYTSDKSFYMEQNQLNTNFEAIKLGDVTGNWSDSPSTRKRFRNKRNHIVLKENMMDVMPSATLSIPVKLDQFTRIQGIDLYIGFDPEKVSIKNVSFGDSILQWHNYQLMYNDSPDGILAISIFAQSDIISTEGDVALIEFSVNRPGQTPLLIEMFECNESDCSGGFEWNGSTVKDMYLNATQLKTQ